MILPRLVTHISGAPSLFDALCKKCFTHVIASQVAAAARGRECDEDASCWLHACAARCDAGVHTCGAVSRWAGLHATCGELGRDAAWSLIRDLPEEALGRSGGDGLGDGGARTSVRELLYDCVDVQTDGVCSGCGRAGARARAFVQALLVSVDVRVLRERMQLMRPYSWNDFRV